MHRTIALVTLVSLAACAAGDAYEIRPAANATPAVAQEQAISDCRVEVMRATAGEQDFGRIVGISNAMWAACLQAKGYERVAVGS